MGNTVCRCQRLAGPNVELHPRSFGQVGVPPARKNVDSPATATESFGGRPYASPMAHTTKRTEEKPC